MDQPINDNKPIIHASNVVKTYPNGVDALDGLNLNIYSGEVVGVLGPSGSGKTTLFRLINGSIAPTRGEVRVVGRGGLGLRKLRARVSSIYQHHNIIPGLSVARNVLMGRLGHMNIFQVFRIAFCLYKGELEEVYMVLERLGLEDKLFDRATDLSGGQQQRVAIARALLSEAPVLLADEPIASVDASMAGVILDLFQELNQVKQTTIVMNLHQEDFALSYCSRIIVLNKGKVIYDGPPDKYLREGRGRLGVEAV